MCRLATMRLRWYGRRNPSQLRMLIGAEVRKMRWNRRLQRPGWCRLPHLVPHLRRLHLGHTARRGRPAPLVVAVADAQEVALRERLPAPHGNEGSPNPKCLLAKGGGTKRFDPGREVHGLDFEVFRTQVAQI